MAKMYRWPAVGALLLTLAVAAGCEPHEKTTDERMQELMAEQDRQLGPFGEPGGSRPAAGPARGPNGEILNWKITVTRYTVEDETGDRLGALWKYADENVHVTAGVAPRDGGLRLRLAGANFMAELDAQRRQTQTSSKTESMLVVMKGQTGLLVVGETRFVPAFVYDGRTFGGALLKTEAVQSLLVRPDSTPDGLVQIGLTPQFSRLEGYNDIVLTQLSTTLLVKPGQPIVIGGEDSAQDRVAGSLFYHNHGSKNAKSLIVLRVDGM